MERTSALLKTLVFTVLVPGFVAVWMPHRLLKPEQHPVFDIAGVAGAVAIVVGALIYLRCAWDFAYSGLGTPAPIDPPKVLVSRGLHKFVRNPMYVGVLLVILGQAALFRSGRILVYAACFAVAVHLFVVWYEEPTLQKKFGPSYDEYRKSVPRWIPKFSRH